MVRYVAMSENGKNGISARKDGEILAVIWDISAVYSDVQNLADTLNKMEVSFVHFYDVIEDYVQQMAM